MTNPPTINAESELVARLRRQVAHDISGCCDPFDQDIFEEAAATIERLASAHEQGRREGIEMAAKVADGWEQQFITASDSEELKSVGREIRDCQVIAAGRIAQDIRALSPAPPGEKGERIPSEAIRHGKIFLALSEPPSTAREAHAQTVVKDLIAALRAALAKEGTP